EDNGLANLILTNGARLYVDHAHPEYSSPEVTNPRDGVIWDKAGELIALEAAQLAGRSGEPIVLYKNNTDNKGVSYGSHENYLVKRATPFADLVRYLTTFFVSRQVVCGSGRVGIGQDGLGHGFQLTQRADFFEVEVGLETTLKRPIINTRDEPHADPDRYRRLHVIIGDANLAETSIYLKLGTTALVLAMIEDGFLDDPLSLATPVASLRAVSHDYTLKHQVELTDGRSMTALQLQWEFHNMAAKYVAHKYGYDVDPQTREVLATWESVLTKLERDPMECADQLDWVAKLKLLESYRDRDDLEWSSAKLALIDLQYSDLRPERSLYQRLVARGRMKRLVTDEEIARAVTEPPEDTRAYFRGRCLAKFADEIAAASWDSVIFDVPGHATLQRIPTGDPLRGTKAHVGDLIDRSSSGQALIEALTR
ncbi:MAG: depupylase/deamidase Dop, partial [Marmoricola sp.]